METFDLITWLELIILAVWIEFGFDMSYSHLACHKVEIPRRLKPEIPSKESVHVAMGLGTIPKWRH